MRFLNSLYQKHQKFWTQKQIKKLIKVLGLFILSLIIQHFADRYVGHIAGVPVGDVILDHLPTVDIDFFIVQGALLFTILMLGLLILKPRYIAFTGAALTVFIVTRSFFISLTHLGIDPHEIVLDTHSIGFGLYNLLYNSKSDFFFSGHTGAPFLMGLIFFRNKRWSRFFFLVSGLLGVSVLLGHIHYSIDVFAAPFMTYSIFIITQKLFPQEYALINAN